MTFLDKAKLFSDELVEMRRHIHQYPEIGMSLPKTTEFVMNKLKEIGLEPEEIIESGITATIGGKKPGKTLLIRADMDALPIHEASGEEFSSKIDGKMHACGHDIHTTMLFGAAKLLKEVEDELEGTVKLMFQPGEEIFKGGKAMVEAGILENPKVDAALDMHVHSPSEIGNLNYSKGPFTTSADNFSIHIEGEGGHGSRPEAAIDPLNVAVQIYQALEALIAREISPNDYAALSVCSIDSGDSFNIIPDKVEMRATMRTYEPVIHEKLKERINEIVENVGAAFNTKTWIEVESGTPAIVNDSEMVDQINTYLSDFGMDFKTNPEMRLPASDDFGYVSTQVPSVMFSIGCKPKAVEKNFVHNPKVVFDEDVLPIGAAVFAQSAFSWLKNN